MPSLILVAIRITMWIQGLFSGFVTIGRYGKWYELQCRACTSRHLRSNYDVITSPAHDRQRNWYCDTGETCLGGGMHCPTASSLRFNAYIF